MYIGEIAAKTGMTVKAIRFYEHIGLIPAPVRKGRYRVYKQSDIELLALIREAKMLGVSLARLKSVIVVDNGEIDWSRVKTLLLELRAILERQIQEIEQKIQRLDCCYDQINQTGITLDSPLQGRL